MSWAMSPNIHRGPRYLLHAYVCERSTVTRVHDLGTRTMAQVFYDRPMDCRYAVVTDEHGGVWVVDLLELLMVSDGDQFVCFRPGKQVGYSDVETAITATVMTDV
jgi:hypothetical protein